MSFSSSCDYLVFRVNIVYQNFSDTTGLAYLHGACLEGSRCAVVEDNGPTVGTSIAHEIGHLYVFIYFLTT